MSFIKNVFNILTDNRELKETIVYKDIEENSPQQNWLKKLKDSNDPNLDIKKIDDHLKLFTIGHNGEKSVMFELQNSMLPLLVLHDIYLEFENYKAQFDFIIITHKFILVLEVKKLFGNIRITDKGEFQRIITKNNRVVNKEGMYSPINQVERHINILEKFLSSKGVITKCPVRGAVTFANPKTIIDISPNAPSTIHTNVIRHDQVTPFIKEELDKKSPVNMLDQSLHDIAKILLQNNREQQFNPKNYILEIPKQKQVAPNRSKPVAMTYNEKLKSSLITYRSRRSKELNLKPYMIFTNKILDVLIDKKPLTASQLLSIEGFGDKKVKDYGEDILKIISQNESPPTKDSSKVKPKQNASTQNSRILKESLIEFRTKKAQELNVKPYYIFTNKCLEDLLNKKPKTINELLKVEGFGPKKAEEFGIEIIKMIN